MDMQSQSHGMVLKGGGGNTCALTALMATKHS